MYTRRATLALASALGLMVNAQLIPSFSYVLQDSHVGFDFLNTFSWLTLDDPTHGRVNYVNQSTALQNNLTVVSASKFIMRADDTTKVASTARGRDSIRIQSLAAYDDALFVLDIAHMPAGCATWPAWWTLSQEGPWPNGGEIDIIEGVNLSQENLASLHTTPNCTMPEYRVQKGNTTSTICDTSVNGNEGCGVSFPESDSFGANFNADGGGFYIMEKNSERGVSVWFLRRWDLLAFGGEPHLDIVVQTIPDAYFPMQGVHSPIVDWPNDNSSCNYAKHFNAHNIVFDLTFCGDWAGAVWSTSSCASKASTCDSFVDNYPHEFTEAYWEINSLKIYTPTGLL